MGMLTCVPATIHNVVESEYGDNSTIIRKSHIKLMPAIYEWAKDTYQFCCRIWGEENIIGFDVHCDETGVHAHALTVPVEQVKKRGRIGSQHVNKDNLIEAIKTIPLERFAANGVCKSLSTVKMQQKNEESQIMLFVFYVLLLYLWSNSDNSIQE